MPSSQREKFGNNWEAPPAGQGAIDSKDFDGGGDTPKSTWRGGYGGYMRSFTFLTVFGDRPVILEIWFNDSLLLLRRFTTSQYFARVFSGDAILPLVLP